MRLWIVVQAGALLLTGSAGIAGAGEPADRPASESVVADGDLTLFLAGDAIITQPWSENTEPPFLGLIDAVRSADVAVVNLELILHDFAGYAQADNGGMHLSARPRIARELAWAGVDMVSGANNHTFDYGSRGVLDTVASATAAGLVIAGSGKDLQAARAPAYYAPSGRHRCPGLRGRQLRALWQGLAHAGGHARASRPQPADHGQAARVALAHGAGALGRSAALPGCVVRRWTMARSSCSTSGSKAWTASDWRRAGGSTPGTWRENLVAVREADAQGRCRHLRDPRPRAGSVAGRKFAYQVIDAGADVFLAHGPHAVQGVKVYRGRPIIYCPGDFVFQPHRVERFPVGDLFGCRPRRRCSDRESVRSHDGPGQAPIRKARRLGGVRLRAPVPRRISWLESDCCHWISVSIGRCPSAASPTARTKGSAARSSRRLPSCPAPTARPSAISRAKTRGVIDLRDPPERPPARASDAIASRRPAALDPALHGNSNVIVDHRDDEPGVEGGE